MESRYDKCNVMIRRERLHLICKGDISLVENYDKAVNDEKNLWVLHHRDEIRVLPSGMVARRSVEELKEAGRYRNCPPNELIFLTAHDHSSLHHKGKKISEASIEKQKDSRIGIVSPRKGAVLHRSTKAKISDFNLKSVGRAFVEHYKMMPFECKRFHSMEAKFYKRHGYFRYEEVQDV